MQTFSCSIAATPTNDAVLAHLSTSGAISVDHAIRKDGCIELVLSENDIFVLEANGMEVECGDALRVRAERDDVFALATDLVTSFVSGYMDERLATIT